MQPGWRIWAQSDETEFLDLFQDGLVLDTEDIRHCGRKNTSVDRLVFQQSTQAYAKKFLAIVLLMSECATVVCNSGNCSMWICLFRGGTRGVHQRHITGWLEGLDVTLGPIKPNDTLKLKDL